MSSPGCSGERQPSLFWPPLQSAVTTDSDAAKPANVDGPPAAHRRSGAQSPAITLSPPGGAARSTLQRQDPLVARRACGQTTVVACTVLMCADPPGTRAGSKTWGRTCMRPCLRARRVRRNSRAPRAGELAPPTWRSSGPVPAAIQMQGCDPQARAALLVATGRADLASRSGYEAVSGSSLRGPASLAGGWWSGGPRGPLLAAIGSA
jgi:hypothetical protein